MDLVVPDATKSIQQNAIEPWSKPHYRAQLAELKRVAQASACGSTCRGPSSTDDEKRFVDRGRRRRLGRRQGLLPLARAQEIQGPRPRVPEPLSRLPDLPRVRRRAAAPRGARRARRRAHHRRRLRPDRARGADASSQTLRAVGEGRGDRRQGAARDPQAARLPARRRARLPDARSAVVDAVGRRVAAHQPGDVARARRWSTRSTCSTSRRSACTRATTSG